MRKILLTCFLFAMGTFAAFAEQVTPSEAKQKAAEFLNSTAPANAPRRVKAAKATLLQVWPAATNTANKVKLKAPAANTGADYYIFNTADSTAFVVVSGESTTRSILAYSTEGFFNMDNIAPGAQYLLDGYAEQIEMVKSGKAVAIQTPEAPIVYGTPRVLSTAAWNQSYNFWWSQCPTYNGVNCHAGCTAAAMAIVMRYHQWPSQGVGSNSYDLGAGYSPKSPSANFGNTTYAWTSLPLGNQSESAAQWTADNQTEVAKILYHCGVSVNMNYATGGSGASTSNAAKALRKNFKYDIYTREYQRMDYTDAVWKQMLMAEIDANRPMIYSGQTSGGAGHAFVCDGYNADGTFHFNMGWGGYQTGNYSIDGIVDGYNLKHLAVMGIKPDKNFDANYTAQLEMATYWYGTAMSEDKRGLKMDTPANIIKGYSFGITAHNLQNVLSSTFNGYVAAALFDATGTTRKSLISSNSTISGLNSGSTYSTRSFTCKVPTDIDMQPTDRIWIMSSTDGNTWYKVYCCSDETSSVAVSGYPDVNVAVTWNTHDTGVTIGNKKDSFVYPNTYTFTVTKPDNKKAVILRVNGTIMQPASTDGNVDTYAYTPTGTTVEFDLSDRSGMWTAGESVGITMTDEANVKLHTSFQLTAINFRNGDISAFSGLWNVGLYGSDGQLKQILSLYNGSYSKPLGQGWGYPSISLPTSNITTNELSVDDQLWAVTSTDGGTTWARVYKSDNTQNWLPVSGYPGVFFCQGHNGQDAYVYGNVTNDVKSQLAAQTDVTRIDLTGATQSNTFDFTGVNPNAYVEGTTASITGALTKSLTALQLTDNKPYYADGTQSVNKVTFTRAFNAGGASSTSSAPLWQTICLPFNVTSVTYNSKTLDVSNYWLYKIGANGYERVRTGNIEANTPYLIAFACGTQYGDESVSGDVTFAGAGTLQTTDVTSELYATSNYKMVSYYGPNITDSTCYALNTTGTCFVSGDAINPFHPYAIVPDEANPAKGHVLSIFGGDVTAIEAVGADKADGGVKIVPAKGGVNVTATKAGTVNVYSTSGALLGVFGTSEGTTFIRLPQGIFVVNGVKVMVSE